jgi:hypothetical protein
MQPGPSWNWPLELWTKPGLLNGCGPTPGGSAGPELNRFVTSRKIEVKPRRTRLDYLRPNRAAPQCCLQFGALRAAWNAVGCPGRNDDSAHSYVRKQVFDVRRQPISLITTSS